MKVRRMSHADGRGASGDTRLGEVAVPPLEEIAASPKFEPVRISRAEFEIVWAKVASTG